MSSENTFGQNDWLVDEMFQQYKDDPNSVDAEWRDLFEKKGAPNTAKGTPTVTPSKDSASQPKTDPKVARTTGAPSQDGRETKVDEAASKVSDAPKRTTPKPKVSPLDKLGKVDVEPGEYQLKGAFKAIAKNMNESLSVPTATTVRDMPVKLMFENRALINDHLKRTRGGKVSFTHILGYAIVQAAKLHPDMNKNYKEDGNKSFAVQPEHINLGLAIDLPGKDGSRSLVVAAIKECETKSFSEFVEAYEDIVKRARDGKLTMDDFSGVTIQLTNPGGIGTRHSIPRLTKGQGTIVGVGAMDYPAEFAGASEDRLAELGVGKLVTLTSTYDHRVIQGAESGEFLRDISQLIIDDKFWDNIFQALEIPYSPLRWAQDVPNTGINKDTRVMQLIESYRSRGHLIADTNPLHWHQPGLPKPDSRDLLMETHGLTLWDLDRSFHVGGFGGKEKMTLREVLSRLRAAYTLKVGSEYSHIMDRDEREWLRDRVEAGMPKPTSAEQKYILQKLNAAEAFENFLQTKYLGQKRFSLEGAETLIPLMDAIIDTAAGQGLEEVVIGMPHRGRLNVLFNIVGKPVETIFTEFEGNMRAAQQGGSGDVKYHLGFEGEHIQMFGDGEIKVSLAANPSHLEAVDPVLVGMARAKADQIKFEKGREDHPVVPLMLHGDASFAGLGIVQETLNLSRLPGYTVGGTIHIVVNNQIGFTTAPHFSRTSPYPTDIALMVEAPIFHVNGDDPEAVVHAAKVATEFRQKFQKDVVLDIFCYRRFGHNEGDEPMFTNPAMYTQIKGHKTTLQLYTERLVADGLIPEGEIEDMKAAFQNHLNEEFEIGKNYKPNKADWLDGRWKNINREGEDYQPGDTAITPETLKDIGRALTTAPDEFEIHKTVTRLIDAKKQMFETGEGFDWATGEALAFAERAGLDGRALVEVISQGAAGSWQMANRHKTMDQGHFDHGFAVDWMRKDLAICLAAAD